MQNFSFVDFPSHGICNSFVADSKHHSFADNCTTLKVQNGMTPTDIAKNKPLYKAMSQIEKNSENFKKEDIKILWKERTLEHKGVKAWVQNSNNNDGGTWYNTWATLNNSMQD